MITGDSGVGKSEAAIELIMRGHRLVADDAVEIRCIADRLVGTAPEVIRNYIELRGIGVIDVRQLFGMRAVMPESQIDLVVEFEPWDSEKFYDRLGIEDRFIDILGKQVACRDRADSAGPEPGQHRGGGGAEQPSPAVWLQCRRGAGPEGGSPGGYGQSARRTGMMDVGIDVGGTNLRAGVVDEQGKLLSRVSAAGGDAEKPGGADPASGRVGSKGSGRCRDAGKPDSVCRCWDSRCGSGGEHPLYLQSPFAGRAV